VKLAQPCEPGDANEANLISMNGCVQIDDLPTEVDIPVFVNRAGYHPFNSIIHVNANVSGSNDLIVGDPYLFTNVRLFPTGVSYDVNITAYVSQNGNQVGVSGVTIRCVYSFQEAFDVLGEVVSTYLSPFNNFPNVISSDTDSNGRVTLAGSSLTKGGEYVCFAHGTDLISGLVVSDADNPIFFTVGVDSPEQPFELFFNNDDLEDTFRVTSVNYSTTQALGSVTAALGINLNTDAVIFPGTEDCQRMFLDDSQGDGADGNPITFETDVDDATGENAESVTVAIDSTNRHIDLTPVLAVGSSTDDIHPIYGFGGLFVMPTDGPNVGSIYDVSGDSNGTNFALDISFGGNACSSIGTEDNLTFTDGNTMDNLALMTN
jgi:hypothetical protein